MISLLLAAALVASEPATPASSPVDAESQLAAEAKALAEAQAFAENATAREILDVCRRMVPTEVEIIGHVNRRSRHGTQVAAYRYVLTRRDGKTDLAFTDKDGNDVPFERNGRLLDTDITWSDLTMDFLWWDDVALDEEAEAESITGIVCKVLLLKKGERAFRAWIDRRTGAMLHANELRMKDGAWKTVREVFCTSLRKFGERWAPRNIEVGPPGAKYRTKIVVEDVR